MCDEHGRSGPVRYLLDNFDVSTNAEFSELVPEHRSVESELSRSDRWYCHNAAHPSGLESYLDEALPICEVSFPRSQGGENPRNILNSRQLTVHYVRDVEVFGARETLYGIVAGIYDLDGE